MFNVKFKVKDRLTNGKSITLKDDSDMNFERVDI